MAGVWQDELGPRSTTGRDAGRNTDGGSRGGRRAWPRPGLLTRGLAPTGPGGGRAPALVLAGLGAAAFAVSLILEWQHITVEAAVDTGQVLSSTNPRAQVSAHVGDLDLFGTVYLVAVIGLLASAGLAVSRPDLAARMRFLLTGGGVGVLAMLVAVAVRASADRLDDPSSPVDVLNYLMGNSDGNVKYTMTLGQGLLFAFAAVLLPLGAVWLASRQSTPSGYPAPTPAAEPDEPDDDEVEDVVDTDGPVSWRPSDPYDLTVTPN